MGSPGGSVSKDSACNAEDLSSIPGLEDPLEEEIATHSSILAWRTPWTEEPGGLLTVHGGHKELDKTFFRSFAHYLTEYFFLCVVYVLSIF